MMKVICAWCGAMMSEGDPGATTSHGIRPPCIAGHFPEIRFEGEVTCGAKSALVFTLKEIDGACRERNGHLPPSSSSAHSSMPFPENPSLRLAASSLHFKNHQPIHSHDDDAHKI